MSRGKDWLRHQRKRIVDKRFHIQYDCWREGHDQPGSHIRSGHKVWGRKWLEARSKKLAKQNLACSCGMCTMGKRPNKRKARHIAKLVLKREDM